MEGSAFDRLTRRHASRRSALGLLGGGLAVLGSDRVDARRRKDSSSRKATKVAICHYTTSTSNPYVIIQVSEQGAADHLAHGDHLAYDCDDGQGLRCTPCVPEVCESSSVGVDPNFDSKDPWVVCRADADSAWLSAASAGKYDPLVACKSLGYSRVGRYGGTCGNICGYCEGQTSCTNPGNEVYDGSGNCGDGTICVTVQWECLR